MRVESREVGFWLVAKKKKSFSIFEEGGSEDEDTYIIFDGFCDSCSYGASTYWVKVIFGRSKYNDKL